MTAFGFLQLLCLWLMLFHFRADIRDSKVHSAKDKQNPDQDDKERDSLLNTSPEGQADKISQQ